MQARTPRARTPACMPACVPACMPMPVCAPACVPACAPACVRACVHACVPASLHICVMCINTYILSFPTVHLLPYWFGIIVSYSTNCLRVSSCYITYRTMYGIVSHDLNMLHIIYIYIYSRHILLLVSLLLFVLLSLLLVLLLFMSVAAEYSCFPARISQTTKTNQ